MKSSWGWGDGDSSQNTLWEKLLSKSALSDFQVSNRSELPGWNMHSFGSPPMSSDRPKDSVWDIENRGLLRTYQNSYLGHVRISLCQQTFIEHPP